MPSSDDAWDILIIGAGAAGLAAGIFAGREALRLGAPLHVAALDGARTIGAKILVSGGGRCNVTNERVSPDDFQGGSRNVVRRLLAELPVDETLAFFREIGVELHVEEFGKYFPDTNRARTVLDALLREAARVGALVKAEHRVHEIRRLAAAAADFDSSAPGPATPEPSFAVRTQRGEFRARRVILATGGLSLPKTGSDGGGYALARSLGHTVTPTYPALAPLVVDSRYHAALSGISHDVALTVRSGAKSIYSHRGPLLWTHFGISGPAAMNVSGPWHKARSLDAAAQVVANLLPGESAESLEHALLDRAEAAPRESLQSWLAERLPSRVAAALLGELRIAPQTALAHLSREVRRRLSAALVAWTLPVVDSRGYAHAEVTAGGVPLREIHAATMESRACPGLFLVGELLDVDGRIGGFNFQWAWCTGLVAGRAAARSCTARPATNTLEAE